MNVSIEQAGNSTVPDKGFPAPVLALRVGVTGNRWHDPKVPQAIRLNPANRGSIEKTIRKVLSEIQASVNAVHAADVNRVFYDKQQPIISIVSPLAEGGDRMVASVAGSLTPAWELDVITSEDLSMTADRDPFVALKPLWDVARSRFILDGERNSDSSISDATFMEVNNRLLWNCDVLIAIWDGNMPQGAAGTGRVIIQALEFGLPVIYIEGAPSALANPAGNSAHDAVHTVHVIEPSATPEKLLDSTYTVGELIARLLAPPQEFIRRSQHEKPVSVRALLNDFRSEKVPNWFLRNFSGAVWGGMMKFLTRNNSKAKPSAWRIPARLSDVYVTWEKSDSPLESLHQTLRQYLEPSFQQADYFATAYSIRHRGSTVWLVMLAPFAVALAWAGEQAKHMVRLGELNEGIPDLIGTFEALVLFAIVAIYSHAVRKRFHERWLDYRLLAERLRYLGFLWLMGRGSLVQRVPLQAAQEDAHTAWVNWWYRATVRRIPVPNVQFEKGYLDAYTVFLRDKIVAGQKAYMDKVYHTAEVAEENLRLYSRRLFASTFLFVFLHIILVKLNVHVWDWLGTLVSISAIVFPGFGAAFHAFASNLGLPEQSLRSSSTIGALDMIQKGIGTVKTSEALASVGIGDLAQQTASALGDDLFGWRVDYLIRPTPQPG
ncbi:MAG: hypothetical protein ABJB66_19255 [Gemmatimonadaceae bacterium]